MVHEIFTFTAYRFLQQLKLYFSAEEDQQLQLYILTRVALTSISVNRKIIQLLSKYQESKIILQ